MPGNSSVFSKKKIDLADPRQLLPRRETTAWLLLDVIADMVISVSLQGIILWVNRAVSQWLDKPIEALINVSIWDVYPPQNVNHYKILFNEVVKTNRSLNFIDKFEDRWIEMLIHPISSDMGELEEVVFQARDVTTQIDAQEALKRISLQLITVQEDERRRIAQDLHDEIGQEMTALLMELRTVQKASVTERPGEADQIRDAIRNLEEIMKGLPQILYQLYPPSLHNAALIEVLRTLCSFFSRSTGIHVDLSSQNDFPMLSNAYEVALYRFVQEGLANAAKHGKANSVWVNLDATDEGISISIEDDGLGFDPKESLPGLGVRGIQERFFMLQGSLEVEFASGKGTKLFGFLPVDTKKT